MFLYLFRDVDSVIVLAGDVSRGSLLVTDERKLNSGVFLFSSKFSFKTIANANCIDKRRNRYSSISGGPGGVGNVLTIRCCSSGGFHGYKNGSRYDSRWRLIEKPQTSSNEGHYVGMCVHLKCETLVQFESSTGCPTSKHHNICWIASILQWHTVTFACTQESTVLRHSTM